MKQLLILFNKQYSTFMKHLLILLFVFSSFTIHSQQKIEDGPYEIFFNNGQIKIQGQYKNKKKVGDWKAFYLTGELKRTYSYQKGKIAVEKKTYFKTGITKTETIKINGDTLYRKYYKAGTLLLEKKLNGGYSKEFYENGNLKTESNYSEGELTKLWKKYFETGELEWEASYISSYLQGVYKQYYKNGKLKTRGVNIKGKKEGLEKRYFENGKLAWEGNYEKGEFHGKWKAYNTSGEQTHIHKYKNGKLLLGSDVILSVTKIPDGLIENVPVYPGCEDVLGFKNQKNCMFNNISELVSKNFNTNLATSQNLTGKQKIAVIFKIDKQGGITDIKARASNKILELEAIRVIKLLPKMKPGMQMGKPVVVPYSLPIIFMVQDKKKGY